MFSWVCLLGWSFFPNHDLHPDQSDTHYYHQIIIHYQVVTIDIYNLSVHHENLCEKITGTLEFPTAAMAVGNLGKARLNIGQRFLQTPEVWPNHDPKRPGAVKKRKKTAERNGFFQGGDWKNPGDFSNIWFLFDVPSFSVFFFNCTC